MVTLLQHARRINGSRRLAGLTKRLCALVFLLAFCAPSVPAQTAASAKPEEQSSSTQIPEREQKLGGNLFNLLNMAGTKTAAEFTPMNQRARNHLFVRTMVNPFSFARVAFSAGIDQWNDKPSEWEQGGSGYGRRYANIFGQYSIQRTVAFAMSSALDEDNRYFNSGKKGFWPRTWYALESGFLARHRDGHRSFSFSQVGGVAAGAFLARLWLPPSQESAADGAVSFAISTAANVGAGVVKEFVPDIIRVFTRKPKSKN
jgi:hypothetical protein